MKVAGPTDEVRQDKLASRPCSTGEESGWQSQRSPGLLPRRSRTSYCRPSFDRAGCHVRDRRRGDWLPSRPLADSA